MTTRIGICMPTSGNTVAGQQTAAALAADLFLWMAMDTNGPHRPADALAFPGGTHIVRIPTPAPGEQPAVWFARVTPILDAWTSAGIPPGALIVQPGNEMDTVGVDVPVPWEIDAWLAAAHSYRDVLVAHYPNLPLLAPPFTCGNTVRITAAYLAGYEGAAIHCYWSQGNPGWRQGRDGGAAWRVATDLGTSVYVTELNSNPADAAEIIAWANEVDSDLLLGATLFIADSVQSFPEYSVSPDQAAAIHAGLHIPPPPSPPPPPPPEQPLDAITAARAVSSDAQVIGAMVMGAALETGRITPPWPDQGGGGPGRGAWQIEAGPGGSHIGEISEDDARDTLKAARFMLADYVAAVRDIGDADWQADPMHAHAEAVYRAERPAARYPEPRVISAWAMVSPLIIVVPPVTTRYQFVFPVDAPIVQGSMGTYSHAGSRPGSVFYAIDWGCTCGTPIWCAADGTVIYNGFNHPLEGQTGHTICIQHDGGYETRYCHLTEYALPVGATVKQGQVIAHSGAPDILVCGDPRQPGVNGFGAGDHLHFSISLNGHWIKVEDLTTAGTMGPWTDTPQEETDMLIQGHIDDGRLRRIYEGLGHGFNPDTGITQRWITEYKAGHPLGAATSDEEHDAASNVQIVYFSNGFIAAYPDGSTSVN